MTFGTSFSFNSRDIDKIPGFENLCIEKELSVFKVSSVNNPSDSSLMFLKNVTEEAVEKLKGVSGCILLIPDGTDINKDIGKSNLLLPSKNPRMDYAIILNHILVLSQTVLDYRALDNGSVIGQNVYIGNNTRIEPHVFIDHNVVIGDQCIVKSGCKIRSNVKIGNHSILHENSVIGGQGFGVESDAENGMIIRLPHVGGVVIGDYVEIGATSNVASGTIDPTEIDDYVKTDDSVHIAHNCKIEKGVLLGAGAIICGSVVIGEYSWIGPNSTVADNKIIGRNSFVVLGAVVLRNVKDNEVVAGNPARQINMD